MLLTGEVRAERPPPPPDHKASIEVENKVRWDPRWQRFELGNYLTTGGLLAVALASFAIPPDEERWTDSNSFDRSVRSTLRLTSKDDQFIARDASDVLLAAAINQLLIDSLVVTWWGHDNGDVAWQMAMMSVEALAFNSAVNGLVTALASRQRPYAQPVEDGGTEGNICVGADEELLDDCRSNKRYRAFYSGHTSATFTIAGLTCMHHAHLPLYGGGAGDAFACVAGFAVAGATGVLRIVSEQHWGTDVLVGAAMGTFHGLMIPWLFHYRTGDLPEAPKDGSIRWYVVPNATGASVTGVF